MRLPCKRERQSLLIMLGVLFAVISVLLLVHCFHSTSMLLNRDRELYRYISFPRIVNPAPPHGSFAYVIGIFTDDEPYFVAARVLLRNMHEVNARVPILVMFTPSISPNKLLRLQEDATRYGMTLRTMPIQVVRPPNGFGGKAKWESTWCKLYAFALSEYSVVIYLDLDLFFLRNFDSLFLSAELNPTYYLGVVQDAGGKQRTPHGYRFFNSGLLVIKSPCRALFEDMLEKLAQYAEDIVLADPGSDKDKRIIADQIFLNFYFGLDATYLPYWVLLSRKMARRYPEYMDLKKIWCVHFLNQKPWVEDYAWSKEELELVVRWRQTRDRLVNDPKLST